MNIKIETYIDQNIHKIGDILSSKYIYIYICICIYLSMRNSKEFEDRYSDIKILCTSAAQAT